MKINKYTILNFIYNGKYYKIKSLFSHKYNDKIPVYVSKDIQGVIALALSDSSIIMIISEDTLNYDKGNIEYYIIRSLSRLYFSSDIPVDVCCSHWFGFSKTIEIISNDKKIPDEQKKKRINTLEKLIVNKKEANLKIPEINNIIDYFEYAEVI